MTTTGAETRAGRQLRATIVAVLTAAAVLLGASAAVARGERAQTPALALSWLAPTPADGKTYTVAPGSPLTVALSAGAKGVASGISASGLPAGAVLTARTGRPASARLNWTPTSAEIGTHAFVFAARSRTGALASQPRTIFIQVAPDATLASASGIKPIGVNGIYRWAYVAQRTAAHTRPTTSSRVVTHLNVFTGDSTVNLVLLLAQTTDANHRVWYRVRLPILPNNSTGWVLADDLTTTRSVTTYLVVYRKLFTATLYRGGRAVFRTRIGVGKPYWPTPNGDFYVREILTGFGDPFYGPVAFGTSARSGVLTDWEGGGGVIGIHGTNTPEILPGRVSHGCIRMDNASVLRLLRLMPLGTPVAIR